MCVNSQSNCKYYWSGKWKKTTKLIIFAYIKNWTANIIEKSS